MTNTAQHTPAPWNIGEDGFIKGVTEYEGCGTHNCEWLNPKDKPLVEAAPELLAALKGLTEKYKGDAKLFAFEKELLAARAAIAKAEGK